MIDPTQLLRLRRLSQSVFFLLFLLSIARTALIPGTAEDAGRNPWFLLDPLPALTAAVAGRCWAAWFWWPLLLLVPALFAGRFFCGWICPVGAVQQWLASIRPKRWRAVAIRSNGNAGWQRTKYYLLLAGLVAALPGVGVLAWFDPLVLATRAVGVSLLPQAASGEFAVVRQPHYQAGLWLLGVTILLLLASLRVTRLWCRLLCPLGALLGLVGRGSRLRLSKDEANCNHCGRCQRNCQGGDDPIPGAIWRHAECHLCLECIPSCPNHCLSFSFGELKQANDKIPARARRALLAALVTGAAAISSLKLHAALGTDSRPKAIRPPGALEELQFLSRCVRCGECMRVCPCHALQPAVAEAGALGFWSPVLASGIGFCAPECVLCTEVCPTGALQQMTAAQKGWAAQPDRTTSPVRLGVAQYDHGRCLPWAQAEECSVCLEGCPIEPRAIWMEPHSSAGRPHIDAERCVGCGACVTVCPLEKPAVTIVSIGDARA